MLLEKQITCNQGSDTETIKIFSAKDIQQATNNYNPNLILGSVIPTVYKGTLDEWEVAIISTIIAMRLLAGSHG